MSKLALAYRAIVIVALAAIAAAAALSAHVRPADANPGQRATPHPVALSDARSAPHTLLYVKRGDAANVLRQCSRGHWFSDVSAYRWDGSALGAQRWNRAHDRILWPVPGEGAVHYNGIRVWNDTRHPILFAGWCG